METIKTMDEMEVCDHIIGKMHEHASIYLANSEKIPDVKWKKHYLQLSKDCAGVARNLRKIVTRLKKDEF